MPVRVLTHFYTDGPECRAAVVGVLLPPHASLILPAGYWQVGMLWRLTALGVITHPAGGGGIARFGITIGGALVFDNSSNTPLHASGRNNVCFSWRVLLFCRTVGAETRTILQPLTASWISGASINTPDPTVGPGPGGRTMTEGLGGGFDSTVPCNVF